MSGSLEGRQYVSTRCLPPITKTTMPPTISISNILVATCLASSHPPNQALRMVFTTVFVIAAKVMAAAAVHELSPSE